MTEKWITAQEMRDLERAAMEAGLVSGLTLMERAGQAVVTEMRARWPEVGQSGQAVRAVVLCGPGNNGGDGFVIARLLHLSGLDVAVFFYGQADRLPPDARINHDRWCALAPRQTHALSIPFVTPAEAAVFSQHIKDDGRPLFIIDALFGIGLTRPLDGLAPVFSALDRPPRGTRHCISIDVPSGLAEDGPLSDGAVHVFSADLVVTFHRAKRALKRGAAFCGTVVVADIGL